MKLPLDKTTLCIVLFCLLTVFLHGPEAQAADFYTFVDEEGLSVTFPTNLVIHTEDDPGPWAQEASLHRPHIQTWFEKDGLESSRVLVITIPHPMGENEKGYIKEIYLLDKDGLIIGYKKFLKQNTQAKVKMKINGVINYMEMYIVCTVHETWEYDIPLAPPQ